MQRSIRTLLFCFLMAGIASACAADPGSLPAATPVPLTAEQLAGKWESEYGFFIVFDTAKGSFSGSYDETAADAGLGIVGDFSLTGDQLSLLEHANSDLCPGQTGRYQAVLAAGDKLRLTISEDPCIYRVEGLFQGGQGGHRLLEFTRVKE